MIDDTERRMIFIGMSAVAGSIVSLWTLPWRKMTWSDRAFALFVGFAFAIFGVPWVIADLMHVDIQPLRVACGTTFFGAAFGIPLIPLIRRKAEKWLGLKEDAA